MLTTITWYASSSYSWQSAAGDYTSANGWSASALILGNVTASVTGSANGGAWDFSASQAVTGLLTSGTYVVLEQVTSGGVRHELLRYTVTVLANPAAVGSGYDARSHVRKVYESLKATIEGRATQSDLSVTIAGRSITKMSLNELLAAYNKYAAMVRAEEDAERLAAGLGSRATVRVRFGRP